MEEGASMMRLDIKVSPSDLPCFGLPMATSITSAEIDVRSSSSWEMPESRADKSVEAEPSTCSIVKLLQVTAPQVSNIFRTRYTINNRCRNRFMMANKPTHFRPKIAIRIIEQSFSKPCSLEILLFSPDLTNSIYIK